MVDYLVFLEQLMEVSYCPLIYDVMIDFKRALLLLCPGHLVRQLEHFERLQVMNSVH